MPSTSLSPWQQVLLNEPAKLVRFISGTLIEARVVANPAICGSEWLAAFQGAQQQTADSNQRSMSWYYGGITLDETILAATAAYTASALSHIAAMWILRNEFDVAVR